MYISRGIMRHLRIILSGFIFSFLFITTLWSGGQPESSDLIQVVATTSIVTDAVYQVGGERIDLIGLIDRTQDPHVYEPTPQDMARVESADIVFVNGFDLEEGLLETLEKIGEHSVIEVSEGVDPIRFDEDEHHEDEHHHDELDPHTWMSPLNVKSWVDIISTTLSEADPRNKAFYMENAKRYKGELDSLHSFILESLKKIPREKRKLVTDHDVFSYFARDYEFEFIGALIPSISTSAEPSPRDLADLVGKIEEEGVEAIFISIEGGENIKKLGSAIQAEIGRYIRIIPLLTGALDVEGSGADSYIGFMEHNVRQIVDGLSE